MRILYVEDDEKLGPLVRYKLVSQCYTVDWVTDGYTALTYMESSDYDLYVLDWMLPGITGIELCREARKRKSQAPILLLTARDAVSDKVEGLMSGADDYLVKPFAFEELLARIYALGRRKETELTEDVHRAGDLTVNFRTLEVKRGDVTLSLTRREFQLLGYLIVNPGQVLSREQILDQVWGLHTDVTPNAVDAAVKLLRKKVDEPFEVKLIRSLRGLGYKLMK